MVFFGLLNAFAMRAHLSIAIIEMVVPVHSNNSSLAALGDGEMMCPKNPQVNKVQIDAENKDNFTGNSILEIYYDQMWNDDDDDYKNPTDRFDWSEELQGIILSSFFWGYLASNIPGILLIQKTSAKSVLGFGVLACGFLNLLTPISVQYGMMELD